MDVSVIIPAYNAGEFLGEALQSVMNQTCRPLEIIVVDDGSTDNTAEVARSFGDVRYVYQPNRGTASALNAGVAMASHDLFAFLDADDVWMPDKIQKQLSIMERNKDIDIVFTWMENFIPANMNESTRSRIEFDPKPKVGIHKSTMLIRRNSFFKIGSFKAGDNIDLLDWYARVKEINANEWIINDVLVKRRIHGNNQTILKKEVLNEIPGIIKKILDRRRS